ncbi:hypothetical protein V490_05310 [Pseudogymnoascus sp. VKM F-3557]|nr:hypothetical protein V490_05310 [Pseudogymnoascus sp. VKM F-3557]
MTSIDELFKKPAIPSHNKRKLDTIQDPNVHYKSPKLSTNGTASGRPQDAIDNDDDVEAGPSRPPDGDEDYGPDIPDDEDGRFFGGGITKDESEILDYMEGQEDANVAPEKIDTAWVRKLALNFEKRISKNSELRAKFENDPQKFMGSEADLDADVKALSLLAEHPELYPEFARLGCVSSLVSLLAHENTDIAIDAIEIISELTDEDVEADPSQWSAVVDAMLESGLLDLLTSNLSRFDESHESDRAGVYHVLSVLENLASQPTHAETIGQDPAVLKYLLARIQKKENPTTQNKQYAAELLAILLQSASATRVHLLTLNGVDTLLQLLAPYRKRDPAHGTEEEEFVENVFDALTCTVDDVAGKSAFLEAEGVELALIMVREGKMARPRALRMLDHALAGQGAEACARLVEGGGLKVIFSVFMKKPDGQTTEHLLGIFASMLRSLPADEAPRIRTLAKFVEGEYGKIARLVGLRREFAGRVGAVEEVIKEEAREADEEEKEEREGEWLSRRLDAGLFCLQTVDVILVWLVAEDEGAERKIKELLSERDEGLSVLGATIKEQLDTMGELETDEQKTTNDMLKTLLQFVE